MDGWELLHNLEIMRPDQGWVIYIAYIRLRPGTIRANLLPVNWQVDSVYLSDIATIIRISEVKFRLKA